MRRILVIAALLGSYCLASQLDYMWMPGQRAVPLPAPAPRRALERAQVERLVRYALLVEGLEKKWTENDVDLMVALAWRESRWDPDDQNPRSTAYGLWQFLDSTWDGARVSKTPDPLLQTVAAVRYIKARYGDPTAAYWFHTEKGWY